MLETNGVFHAAVPDYLMKTPDQCSGQVMVGKGQWSSSTQWLETRVKLDFDEVDGRQINWETDRLIVEKSKGGIQMFFWVGEEGGDRFVFVRTP